MDEDIDIITDSDDDMSLNEWLSGFVSDDDVS